jgi:hypothetical protein
MMIAMEARAPALNRLRSWTLAADQDLFGQWQAVVTFGRIGRHGDMRCRKRLASLALCDVRCDGGETPRAGSASTTNRWKLHFRFSHFARSSISTFAAISAGAWEYGLRTGGRRIRGALDRSYRARRPRRQVG